MDESLAVDNLEIRLGNRTVLSDVNLMIGRGRFVGLLGPNGAGKSTLMRTILGLIRPVRGELRVLGGPATSGHALVGYLPQTRTLNASSKLRGYDFVASAVNGYRWGLFRTTRAVHREVRWALEQVQAQSLALRPMGELSGGERQRLLLAQALIGHPRLLLLDEPLAGLDPRHQQAVVALVEQVRATLGATVIFSAHDINPLLGAVTDVLYLGNRQAVMGTVQEVINGAVLSRLYGMPIDVIHQQGRIFVMAGHVAAEDSHHVHDA